MGIQRQMFFPGLADGLIGMFAVYYIEGASAFTWTFRRDFYTMIKRKICRTKFWKEAYYVKSMRL